jgi:uncharacterized protein YhjY with autotransporter beta-barrel domain
MNPTRHLLQLLSLVSLACLAPGQTATWLGQTPADSTRFSSWTDGANWSAGTVPNGSSAVAQLDQAYNTPGGLIIHDNLQILNADVTLGMLQYNIYTPSYNYPSYTAPSILIGGTGATDLGSLEFTGTGIRALNTAGYYYPANPLVLRNGALRFTNSASVAVPTTIDAQAGTNRIWFGDNSQAANISITMGPETRLEFAGRAILSNGNVTFNGGHIGFSGHSSLNGGLLNIYGPGLIVFSDQATAADANFNFYPTAPGNTSILNFSGHTILMSGSAYSYRNSGVVEFTEQADSDYFHPFNVSYVRQLEVSGAVTGTGTTGRLRATVNTPAATSVVADDARTISLGNVNVTDLLLGSNSVRLQSGYLDYVSDIGGAYLSAAGANLTGGGIIMDGGSPSTLFLAPSKETAYAFPLGIASGSVYTDRLKLGPVIVYNNGSLILRAGTAASILNYGSVNLASTNYRVTGDYTQEPSGTLSLSVPYSGGSVPLLDIAGQASLAGKLQTYNSGFFVGTRRHTILRAGSLTGRFATAPNINLSPMLNIGVEYSGNEVVFAYTQRPFVNAGATASQQALGAHLDATLGNATGEFYNLVLRLNTMQDPAIIAAGLGQLAPDRYGVLNEQGFVTAAARQSALDRQLARLRTGPPADGFAVLVEGGQQQNEFSALDGLPAVTFRSSGGMAGVTWRQGRWSAGLTAARDNSRADLDGIGSRAQITSIAPGVFAQYDAGRFFINAAASRSRDDYTLVRNSGLISRPSVVSAAPSGRRTDLSLTAGTSLKQKSGTVTPYAGILASHVELDDFTESRVSGAAGSELAFTRWSVGSLRTRIGFDLTGDAGRLTPRLSLVWLHELEKNRGLSAGLVAAGGARYRAPGRPAETDLVEASFGLDWRITRKFGFSVNAGLAQGKNTDITSDLSAGFRYEF